MAALHCENVKWAAFRRPRLAFWRARGEILPAVSACSHLRHVGNICRTLDMAPLRESSPQKRSGMARVLKGSHRLNLYTHTFIRSRNEPYLPLPSQLQLVLIY